MIAAAVAFEIEQSALAHAGGGGNTTNTLIMVGVLLPCVSDTMSEITRDDEIETGDRLRVNYDGESIEGEVVREELHKDKVVLQSDDGQGYTLFVPEHSFESWMLDEGGADGPSGRSRVTGDADSVERVDGEDEDDGPEVMTDGGQDVPEHIDDETIEAAIRQHDDPEHRGNLTVDDVRDMLGQIQWAVEEFWGEEVDNIERGDYEVVGETDDLIIVDTGQINVVHQHFDHDPNLPDDPIAKSVVTTVMHQAIPRSVDHDYQVTYPLILRKPDDFDAGQRYVEAVVNSLQQRGCSPGQAWAYYGAEIRGNSRNNWGLRKGDHDHKNVSDALEKAKQILP